ncbi:hypothetical protein KL925_003260 [Ogataea polymorpha]|nr:hypothetical protein KL925_003260 [Ogataea polymorpha]
MLIVGSSKSLYHGQRTTISSWLTELANNPPASFSFNVLSPEFGTSLLKYCAQIDEKDNECKVSKIILFWPAVHSIISHHPANLY